MPNNVETKMWLVPARGENQLTDKEVESFFSQFITSVAEPREVEDPRFFNFETLVPPPDNIWRGDIGGRAENNLKTIEEYGGLDAVKQAMKDGKRYPFEKSPCLTDEQIAQFGLVGWYDWNVKNWGTKWGAYECRFDWSARYGGDGYAQVSFETAWSVPEKILRMVRNIAVEHGYDIKCEFGGELDYPGSYSNGSFVYWEGRWNEETEELERFGAPVEAHY